MNMTSTPPLGTSLLVSAEKKAALLEQSRTEKWKSWRLTHRQMCDLELLLTGGFCPLRTFMDSASYERCLSEMRLASGELFPLPVTLDVSHEFSEEVTEGEWVLLVTTGMVPLAAIQVTDKFTIPKEREAQAAYGTTDSKHPAVSYLQEQSGDVALGSNQPIVGFELPFHSDYRHNRQTPEQMREHFAQAGLSRVVAFQTRNPMHRAHAEIAMRAADEADAHLLIHPVVGMTKAGDIDYQVRVRCYNHVLKRMGDRASLNLLPLAMRMAGPKEAVLHAIVRRNYGCTHLVVGRDHAGPGNDSQGEPFYGPYDAQEMVSQYEEELGVSMVPFRMMVYVRDRDSYMEIGEAKGLDTANISGTELRAMLTRGEDIPTWFTYPEIAEELKKSTQPTPADRGAVVLLTGLPSSGKSTVAEVVASQLRECTDRAVHCLDGDIVRQMLTKGLGFSPEDRFTNVERVGYVASLIAATGGIALMSVIAPEQVMRDRVRETAAAHGTSFFEVFIDCDVEVCEQRDRRGMYASAKAGIIKGFTGVDAEYEVPVAPDLHLQTHKTGIDESAERVVALLDAKLNFTG